MRTTLEIDDAVLAAAKALAKDSHSSVGAALSELARRGLAPTAHPPAHLFLDQRSLSSAPDVEAVHV